ncbi:unnamed protein product [Rotaria magnacalcarata]|uniref:Xenotropic and polytropic retrovirus receptor 1 n=2 Tax=Rotaria magnacalcarata TaxID=392030 RepID=A0A819HTL3_9BILA|nr:unnamed protein product [Rotaria magnacalcarata]CAF2192135.1 unnamed protein product [Rotaria magnacalcarata]CAF3902494.1 unnamed protein product [Rotaria magnacalcarata]CAF4121160.1 unnamed protein product [Rotaria magnacalcarata]
MKFAEHLSAHVTPEWNSQYIRYDEMKELLAQAIAKAQPFVDENDKLLREQFFLRVDEHFFQYCEKEATKINTFFAEKLAEASRRWETLKYEVMQMEQARRSTLHRSTVISSGSAGSNDPNIGATNTDGGTSTELKHRSGHSEDDRLTASLTRALPERLLEKTREKHSQRVQYRKRTDLKLAFSEFYLMLVLLQNYQTLNFMGFRKILKKHDKLFQITRGEEWRKLHIDSAPFHTSQRVDQLISDVETLYTDTFESGNRARAMKRLRVPPLEEKQSPVVTFRVGIFVGMLCLLLPAVIVLGTHLHDSQSTKPLAWRQALFLYRSTFLVVLHIVLVGINVYGWSSSGVNHVLIFEIDPRNHLTYQQFLEIGTFLFVLWFLSFTGFILSSYYDFHPFVQPLGFVTLILLFLFNPTPTLYHQARFWFLKTLYRVICAPFYRVGFADFWLGDQLTSLELIFFDIEYFFCFYIYDVGWWPVYSLSPTRSALCNGWPQIVLQTILMILPSWFRFAQCLRRYRDTKQKFPHLANAGKYATGFLVISTNSLRRATAIHFLNDPTANPFLYVWIVASFIGATYKLIWDFKMDWGFFDANDNENKFLREQIVYPSKFYYYAGIIQDVTFRYIWIINVFMHFRTRSAEYADVIGFIFGLIEVFRRFIWNYFRLENEHLNNCGEFRAVRDISIAPISTIVDHGTLEDMMDKENGIRNRRNAKRHDLTKEKIKRKTLTTNQATDNDTAHVNTPSQSIFNIDKIADEFDINVTDPLLT